MSKKINHLDFVNYIINIIPKYIKKNIVLKSKENCIIINTKQEYLVFLINFLKNNWKLKFLTLTAITAVDYPSDLNRFKIIYFLLSYKLNKRIRVVLDTKDLDPVDSVSSIFNSANWYEREIWDLFGIFFNNHQDLRRILTDYGFEGFPLRKDFPQTGFVEVRYDDEKKFVLYESLEITQEYRNFNFLNPWSNIK